MKLITYTDTAGTTYIQIILTRQQGIRILNTYNRPTHSSLDAETVAVRIYQLIKDLDPKWKAFAPPRLIPSNATDFLQIRPTGTTNFRSNIGRKGRRIAVAAGEKIGIPCFTFLPGLVLTTNEIDLIKRSISTLRRRLAFATKVGLLNQARIAKCLKYCHRALHTSRMLEAQALSLSKQSTKKAEIKELPTEIWTLIARLTKRPQPPPRVQANWNDDFNQQDLTSLMRVNKVCSLSYVPSMD